MKKLLLIALLTGLSAPAYAGNLPLYLSIGAGLNAPRDSDFDITGASGSIDLDSAAVFSAALGTNINSHVRAEAEVSYRKSDINDVTIDGFGSLTDEDGELKTWSLLLNGYYDFMPENKFSPYLSAGIGAARHKGELTSTGVTANDSDTVFAYQVGAGANYKIADQTSLWGGYRYLGTSDPDFEDLSAEYHANEFRVGVKFDF